jgi:hypothetical protein
MNTVTHTRSYSGYRPRVRPIIPQPLKQRYPWETPLTSLRPIEIIC